MRSGSERPRGSMFTEGIGDGVSIAGIASVAIAVVVAMTVVAGAVLGLAAVSASAVAADAASDTPNVTSNASSTGEPEIRELYPNPPTEGNRGEYLVVRLPTSGNWSVCKWPR